MFLGVHVPRLLMEVIPRGIECMPKKPSFLRCLEDSIQTTGSFCAQAGGGVSPGQYGGQPEPMTCALTRYLPFTSCGALHTGGRRRSSGQHGGQPEPMTCHHQQTSPIISYGAFERRQAAAFVDLEADVSADEGCSSDEAEDGEDLEGFAVAGLIDDASQPPPGSSEPARCACSGALPPSW